MNGPSKKPRRTAHMPQFIERDMEEETEALEEMERELEEMRECYRSGRTMEASWRKSQLKGLLRLLREREEEIFRALHQDLGKHPAEAYRDEVNLDYIGRTSFLMRDSFMH